MGHLRRDGNPSGETVTEKLLTLRSRPCTNIVRRANTVSVDRAVNGLGDVLNILGGGPLGSCSNITRSELRRLIDNVSHRLKMQFSSAR